MVRDVHHEAAAVGGRVVEGEGSEGQTGADTERDRALALEGAGPPNLTERGQVDDDVADGGEPSP